MAKIQQDIGEGLNWLGSILKYIKEYGVFKIIKALFLLVMLGLTLRLTYNPMLIFEKYTEYIRERHRTELEKRGEYDKQVKALLPVYLYKYHANRVWILQYHNGVMDWQHGTMRFEICKEDTPSIKDQYNNINLTWLNLPYYLQEHEIFIGNINEIKEIDPTLANQLEKNNITYLACTVIWDSEGHIIGVFGVTWSSTEIDITTFKSKIYNYLIEDRTEIKTLIQKQ